jgi:serine/threonine protein kinase
VLNVVGMTRINEVHGHREGDALLRHLAEVAVYVVRGSDIVARYDGDDLAVVFHGTTASQAVTVVERIRHTVASAPIRTDDGQEIHVTTTAGVTGLGATEDSGERALARAAAAAARGNDGAVVTAFFDGDKIERTSVPIRRALDGVTFGGTYRVLHEIGAGGGGGVFRGEDLGLRRPVAIKILRAEQSQNEELVERFRAEAATLAALRHTNLVQVYAFGLEDGHAYFVMELVEGESLFDAVLRSRRERRPIPIDRIVMVLEQISSALRTLHRAGIIHRDVKPANVLIDPFRDRAVLVDVGIASRHGQRANLAGTPGYMAPEAATTVDITASADVYGLAVTLYELLTLRLPWPTDDDPLRMIQNQRSIAPTPPSSIHPALAALDEPLLCAMRVEPTERFANVEKFSTAMRRALAAMSNVATPDSITPSSSESVPESAEDHGAIAHAPTVVWQSSPGEDEPTTRGVVFRALPRVIGARNTATWRLELGAPQPRLAEVLSPATLPLGWLPTRLLVELLTSPPNDYPRAATLGRDLGRASVRATFRRFFPASAVTLAPGGTLSALPSIWPRYHSWGTVRVVPHVSDRMTVLIQRTPAVACLCDWTMGAIEQLVLLSGGDKVAVEHERCEARGAPECAFEVTWHWDPASNRSWRPT